MEDTPEPDRLAPAEALEKKRDRLRWAEEDRREWLAGIPARIAQEFKEDNDALQYWVRIGNRREYDNELYGILRHGRILAVKAPWPEEATEVHDERAPWEQLGRAMPGSPEDRDNQHFAQAN